METGTDEQTLLQVCGGCSKALGCSTHTQFSPSKSNGDHTVLLILIPANAYCTLTGHQCSAEYLANISASSQNNSTAVTFYKEGSWGSAGLMGPFYKCLIETVSYLQSFFVKAFSELLFVCLSAAFPQSTSLSILKQSFPFSSVTACFSSLLLRLLWEVLPTTVSPL